MVNFLWRTISMPQSHVNDRCSSDGNLRTCLLSVDTTLAVSFSRIFTSMVKRECRPTKVAMWVFLDPVIRSPSKWSGIALTCLISSISCEQNTVYTKYRTGPIAILFKEEHTFRLPVVTPPIRQGRADETGGT